MRYRIALAVAAAALAVAACDRGAAPATVAPATADAPAAASSAVVSPAATPAPQGDAAATARAFYRLHLQDASGLPELSRYRPLLSTRLAASIEAAARERDRAIAEHPDEKPPFIEGDMFSSLFEGPTGFELGKRTVLGPDRERFEVEFVHAQGKDVERWKDYVELVREDGAWKLDDVEYAGGWDFAPRGRLSASLSLQ